MAALSPANSSGGKKTGRSLVILRAPGCQPAVAGVSPILAARCRKDPAKLTSIAACLNRALALTPPAMTMDLTSGYFSAAFWRFSRRMSTAVCSKLAAKSATCCLVRWFLRS